MLQTNPIHQSQHGVLHADESFKALLVYSRYHKWLPKDGCLQLDLFFLYSIFLFLNEVLVFLCFFGGFCFLFGLDDAIRVSAACFRVYMGAFSCCCGGVPTMAIMLPLYVFFLNHNRNKLGNQGKSYPFTPLLSDKNQNLENSV